MITLKTIHKSYTTGRNSLHVLKGIELKIEEGELISIMGSSGSGKSTLLNVIGILDGYDKGEYTLDGELITNLEVQTEPEKYEKRYPEFRISDGINIKVIEGLSEEDKIKDPTRREKTEQS